MTADIRVFENRVIALCVEANDFKPSMPLLIAPDGKKVVASSNENLKYKYEIHTISTFDQERLFRMYFDGHYEVGIGTYTETAESRKGLVVPIVEKILTDSNGHIHLIYPETFCK